MFHNTIFKSATIATGGSLAVDTVDQLAPIITNDNLGLILKAVIAIFTMLQVYYTNRKQRNKSNKTEQ